MERPVKSAAHRMTSMDHKSLQLKTKGLRVCRKRNIVKEFIFPPNQSICSLSVRASSLDIVGVGDNPSIRFQPLAAAATKDSHGPSNTPPVRQQPELHRPFVKVFIGDPPAFLFSVSLVTSWGAVTVRNDEAAGLLAGDHRR